MNFRIIFLLPKIHNFEFFPLNNCQLETYRNAAQNRSRHMSRTKIIHNLQQLLYIFSQLKNHLNTNKKCDQVRLMSFCEYFRWKCVSFTILTLNLLIHYKYYDCKHSIFKISFSHTSTMQSMRQYKISLYLFRKIIST